ncbi:uncharacterized protein HGUI_02866 [Hanseniaspora guilliermondii]|uniref:non-specific serine/threonine protein kinase n=1 Tax=Hanseniaspora guilliermondii TaxID=56406 RepID=A0A1L0B2P1_9ASCO|nr:uncharacterized protein HGUI_02866 [Hanseniaspora guilliermondii]
MIKSWKIRNRLIHLLTLITFFLSFAQAKHLNLTKNKKELISKLHIGSSSSAQSQSTHVNSLSPKSVHTVQNAVSGSEATLQRKKGILNLFETNLSNIALLSDINGGLHAVDRYSGERFWSIFHEECDYNNANETKACPGLVDVQETKINEDDLEDYQFSETLIVEPYDEGSLYFFNTFTGLHKIPATIKQLVDQSPIQLKTLVMVDSKGTLLEDEKIYTGHKKSVIYSIDALSGEVLAVYGDDAEKSKINFQRLTNTKAAMESTHLSSSTVATTPQPSEGFNSNKKNSNSSGSNNSKERQVKPLTIGRTTYNLEIHSPLQNTKYNISFTTWQHNSLDNNLISKYGWPTDNNLIIPVSKKDGLVVGLDLGEILENGKNDKQSIKWVTGGMNIMKAGEIVNVFDIFEENSNDIHQGESFILPHPFMAHDYYKRIHEYNLLPNSVYLSKTRAGSWFALSRYTYPALVDSAPISNYQQRIFDDKTKMFNSKDIEGVHYIADKQFNNYFEERNKYDYQLKLHRRYHSLNEYDTNSEHLPAVYFNNDYMLDHFKPKNKYEMEDDYNTDGYLPYIEDTDSFDYFDKRPDVFHVKPPHMNDDLRHRYGYPMDPFLRPKKLTFTEEVTRGFLHMIGWSVFKIIETTSFVLIIFLIIMLISKAKLGTNFKVLIEKSGFKFSFEQENIRLIESSTLPLPSANNTSENTIQSAEIGSDNDDTDTLNELEVKKPQFIDATGTSQKKKRKRGKRSGTKSKVKKETVSQIEIFTSIKDHSYDEDHSDNVNSSEKTITSSMESTDKKLVNITLSNKILGYGSAGTVVYQGSFQNRSVAVKRLLLEFYDIASQEIKLLTMSDDHPNVVRYYCSEVTDKFLYIALELCSTSLDCVIERAKSFNSRKMAEIYENFDSIDCLRQITSGVDYLHSLKIVHRDLKPQNILVSLTSKSKVRVIISDFGVCKKLETEESSYKTNNKGGPVGTQGWRAPELLLLKNNGILSNNNSLEDLTLNKLNSVETDLQEDTIKDLEEKNRLTRAMDIFSLGCIFYYVLSNGKHPFGKSYIRENNIIKDQYDLSDIKMDPTMKHYEIEAHFLIVDMINSNPSLRPTASKILKYPLFWDILRNLEFLLKVSDRMEVERRDPPSPLLLKFNAISPNIISNGDWMRNFDTIYIENLGKYRKYQKDKIIDLLRTFRNKYHHFMDLQDDLKLLFSPFPDGFFTYYIRRFPSLIIDIYNFVDENLKDDQILKDFF